MSKENSIDHLKFFLKEMFQFNANDLDFGIYKIYNLKRKDIENFIDGNDEQCLEPIINKTLELVNNIEKQVEQTRLKAYLKKFNQESLVNDPAANYEKIQQLIINFGDNDQEKESLTAALNASTKEFNITDEIKDKIYNHILGFFEMYYSNGDFGYNNRSRNLYKVPYEADYDGSDTMFHWKHKGSLYIKTGNSFNAIKFKIKHFDKEFELRLETNEESKEEEVARNNNKDTKIKHYKFNRFEEKDGVTKVIFNLSDASTTKADLFKSIFKEVFKIEENLDKYLFAEGKPVFNDLTDDYDKVQDGSVKGIGALRVNRKTLLNKVNKNFERDSKIEIITENGQERFSDLTLETIYNIDQKLNSFYIGNDSDYFIHENLKEFLTQEKERYIKNHILSDLDSILNFKLDNTTVIIAKAFNEITSRIIEFLSTIEEFQKKLFTMKKKVVESEYCLTIDNIDEKYYKEILENKAQLDEWENLFSVKVNTIADLKAQPTLVLDTKFFKQKDGSNPFKDKILAELENLDERTNGLLINSENYQALSFIEEKFKESVDFIYIDPPYNTGNDFIYKDSFRNSSWLSMMSNRINIAKSLMNKSGVFCCSIGNEENYNLSQLLDQLFMEFNKIDNVTRVAKSASDKGTFFAPSIDYLHLYSKQKSEVPEFKGEVDESLYKKTETKGEFKGLKYRDDVAFYQSSLDPLRGCANQRYFVECPDGTFVIPPGNSMPQEVKDASFIPPKTKNDKVWRWSYETYLKQKHLLVFKETKRSPLINEKGEKAKYNVYTKSYLLERKEKGTKPRNFIDDIFNRKGADLIKHFNIDFPYSKPVELPEYLLKIANINGRKIVLDFFAGSGTTGHSVINMNLNDEEGCRFYILIEMDSYFNSVTKPRIQKVIYSQNWKDGKPLDNDGSNNHIFKYLVLEQYEDVLDAIEQFEGETPKNLPLKYLYKPELNKINSTLDLSKPFSNKIRYGQPTKEGYVDLVETYNYLQGYEVKSIKTYTIGKKYYKVVETADTLVIWRDIALGEDDSKVIKEIAEKYPEALQIEVNYDFNILATLKDRQLQVGNRLLGLTVIHADIFNQ
jgi:adenine-specific DNA-methyltransferase